MGAEATLVATETWIQKHERILIVALALLAGSWGLNHYLNNAASKAEIRAGAAEQALSDRKAQDAANAATEAQVLAQYQGMVQVLTTQNSALAAAAAQRQAIVAKNQATDATLALPDLANRLKTLGNAPDGSVSVSNGQVQLTQPGAVAVTQTLEEVPALKADIQDLKAYSQAQAQANAQADQVIAAQGTQITGLNLTLGDQEKMCKAQIAAVKAEANKSKWHYFKLGFITGFLGGLYAGHSGL